MNQIPWYQSAIIRQQVVMLVVGLLGLLNIATDIDIDATVTAVFAGIAALVPMWTIITRLFKPTPPITTTAVLMTEARESAQASKEGGFIRAGMLGLILAVSAIPVLATLPGCTFLGIPQATTFNERLAVGYATVTGIRDTAATLLTAGQISKEDAVNIQAQADNARAALDVTRSLAGINVTAAEERLASTLRILEALQTYLESRTP